MRTRLRASLFALALGLTGCTGDGRGPDWFSDRPKYDERAFNTSTAPTASTKAAEAISAACAGEVPAKATERLGLMEKRLDAMLMAIKTVRPAFEKLYGALDDGQRNRLDAAGPRRWGWNAWRWRWSER